MERDKREIPLIVTKCVEAIEEYGLKSVGLYRLSGTNTHIQRLKNEFDFSMLCIYGYVWNKANYMIDCEEVDLSSEENRNDINNITSLLKLWFRELPDPVFPRSSYQHFMNAASRVLHILFIHDRIDALYLYRN